METPLSNQTQDHNIQIRCVIAAINIGLRCIQWFFECKTKENSSTKTTQPTVQGTKFIQQIIPFWFSGQYVIKRKKQRKKKKYYKYNIDAMQMT